MSMKKWFRLGLGLGLALLAGTPSLATTNTLVPLGAVWHYLDDGSDQGSGWIAPSFNDNAWLFGPGQLGYGDGDEATIVGYGPDLNNKFVTPYFRHSFNVLDASLY